MVLLATVIGLFVIGGSFDGLAMHAIGGSFDGLAMYVGVDTNGGPDVDTVVTHKL